MGFHGSALSDLGGFPQAVMREAGYQLDRVQHGLEPSDAKPMQSIGAGVMELHIRDDTGAFRVVYLAKLTDAIHVLHCFQEKTQQTSKHDIDLARKRLKEITGRAAP